MSTFDYGVAGMCVAVAAVLLARSRALRVILWESLRHPLSKGWVERRGDHVTVHRGVSLDEARQLWPHHFGAEEPPKKPEAPAP
jgi:hypothetical protein